MKKTAALLMALGLALPAITLAQDKDPRPPRDEGAPARESNRDEGPRDHAHRDSPPGRRDEAMAERRGPAGDRRGPDADRSREGGRPMVPPLFGLLDENHDGAIDKKELKQAFKQLDKNGDGKLTPEELRPRRMEGERGEGRPGRPGGNREMSRRDDREMSRRDADRRPADRAGDRPEPGRRPLHEPRSERE